MSNYSPDKRDCSAAISKSKIKIKKLKNKLTYPKDKGQLRIVEEIAIETTKIYLWKRGYWIMREQQSKGPADLYAYKIVNNKKIDYFIDAKGIHPKVNYKPAFKRRSSKAFRDRDKVINRIQSIVYKDEIRFKDLDNRLVEII
tara:strand:- start:274 stop:702 length:429 start_codon:yes stop_codon:yes gene_type:complete